ncbi:hypothetical protein [Noviherbaspirillum massiliense]|uniref:hypothetical protein n=1 Tax=Noviherbaspirillum massiliense TaxID=1465823 RepID=UPI0002FE26BD|nr:hypothetical protein [Noviherbaspirillum massiliense]
MSFHVFCNRYGLASLLAVILAACGGDGSNGPANALSGGTQLATTTIVPGTADPETSPSPSSGATNGTTPAATDTVPTGTAPGDTTGTTPTGTASTPAGTSTTPAGTGTTPAATGTTPAGGTTPTGGTGTAGTGTAPGSAGTTPATTGTPSTGTTPITTGTTPTIPGTTVTPPPTGTAPPTSPKAPVDFVLRTTLPVNIAGQPVTFLAIVTFNSGSGFSPRPTSPPTGTVKIQLDDQQCDAVLQPSPTGLAATGQCTIQKSPAPGIAQVALSYSGDAVYAPASTRQPVNFVAPDSGTAPVDFNLSTMKQVNVAGDPVTFILSLGFDARSNFSPKPTVAPTGTVKFQFEGHQCEGMLSPVQQTPLTSTAQCTFQKSPVPGVAEVALAYSGDTVYAPASDRKGVNFIAPEQKAPPEPVVVQPPPSSTIIVTVVNTVNVTVSGNNNGGNAGGNTNTGAQPTSQAGQPAQAPLLDATAARFNGPFGIARDRQGNLYVSDQNNFTVRKIASNGAVTTLAGKAGEKRKRQRHRFPGQVHGARADCRG